MSRRYVLLDVEDSRADELIEALAKRTYLRVVRLDHGERQRLGKCPICRIPFPKEQKLSVTYEVVEGLVALAERMHVFKSVILVNKKKPISLLSIHDRERSAEFAADEIEKAKQFGFIEEYMDGRHMVHHLTLNGLAYLAGKDTKPGKILICDGKFVGREETYTNIADVRYKDRVALGQLVMRGKKAVRDLPEHIRMFIEHGQAPLF